MSLIVFWMGPERSIVCGDTRLTRVVDGTTADGGASKLFQVGKRAIVGVTGFETFGEANSSVTDSVAHLCAAESAQKDPQGLLRAIEGEVECLLAGASPEVQGWIHKEATAHFGGALFAALWHCRNHGEIDLASLRVISERRGERTFVHGVIAPIAERATTTGANPALWVQGVDIPLEAKQCFQAAFKGDLSDCEILAIAERCYADLGDARVGGVIEVAVIDQSGFRWLRSVAN